MEVLLERIKELCKSRSITVSALEGILNLPSNTIYQWKKRVPGTERLQSVADYFNVSIDYLLGRTDNPNVIEDDENPSMAKQVMMRMDTEGLSETQLDEIEDEMERFFKWRLEEIKRERNEE